MAERSCAWTIGPAASPVVRWLLNLAAASILVGIVAVLVPVGVVLSSPPVAVGLLFGILMVVKVAEMVLVAREYPVYWLIESYASAYHPLEFGVATVAVAGLFLAIPLSNRLASRLMLLVCLGLFVGARLTSSKGTLDVTSGTLVYTGGREYEVPLASVSSLKRYTVGGRTYLWLTFRNADGTPVDRLVLVPTAVWEDAGHLVESSIGTGEAPEASDRSSRIELVAGVVVFGTLVGGVAATVYYATGRLLMAVVFPSVFLVPFLLVVVSYFTNVFATPDRR